MTGGRASCSRRRALLGAPIALAACAETVRLAPPPTLYQGGAPYPAGGVPAAQRDVVASLLYVTDRARGDGGRRSVIYGSDRSQSMAFGVARMRFGQARDWRAVLAESVGAPERSGLRLRLLDTAEAVRWPPTPLPLVGGGAEAAETRARYRDKSDSLQATISREIEVTGQRRALVFIHGYRSSFEDALGSLANIWHYTGRKGLPIAYSWPAGNPGAFGYFSDRESGAFSVYHLKEFLRLLAAIPTLERIDVIAHSRGAEVATSALREMGIRLQGAGRDPRHVLKIENLILAAPDLDLGIVRQRLVAERFARNFGRITVYLNSEDRALALAQWLLTGIRFGRIRPDDLTKADREIFERLGNVDFIDVANAVGRASHSYFRENPAVVSDILRILRTDAPPGAAPRPLEPLGGPFWRLDQGYLRSASPDT